MVCVAFSNPQGVPARGGGAGAPPPQGVPVRGGSGGRSLGSGPGTTAPSSPLRPPGIDAPARGGSLGGRDAPLLATAWPLRGWTGGGGQAPGAWSPAIEGERTG